MTHITNEATGKRQAADLPSALQLLPGLLQGCKPAFFLDYDGCLSPIVSRPEMAVLSTEMRETLQMVASKFIVAVVSGRDRENMRNLVQLENVYYAGSHGYDISGPDNLFAEPGGASDALPALDKAEKELQHKLHAIPGVLIERKKYAIAVHYRNVAHEQEEEVIKLTRSVINVNPQLKEGSGKKILEVKPAFDWNKGEAVLWLLDFLKLNTTDVMPIYIGDDITDEDAFEALQTIGIGILVGEHGERTAANYNLESVDEVRMLFEEVLKI